MGEVLVKLFSFPAKLSTHSFGLYSVDLFSNNMEDHSLGKTLMLIEILLK